MGSSSGTRKKWRNCRLVVSREIIPVGKKWRSCIGSWRIDMPKVSVIVPVYNAERYLAQCGQHFGSDPAGYASDSGGRRVHGFFPRRFATPMPEKTGASRSFTRSTDGRPLPEMPGSGRRPENTLRLWMRMTGSLRRCTRLCWRRGRMFACAIMCAFGAARSFPFPSPTWRKASMTGRRCGSGFFLTWSWTAWNFPLPFPTVYC